MQAKVIHHVPEGFMSLVMLNAITAPQKDCYTQVTERVLTSVKH